MYSLKITPPSLAASTLALLLTPSLVLAQGGTIGDINKPAKEVIIEPEKKPVEAKAAEIDTERFEIGLHLGVLNVEDFNANLSTGLSFTWRLMDGVLAELRYTQATTERATFEELADQDFLADSDRKFSAIEVLGGYRVLNGRSFFGRSAKIDSELYLLGGLGQASFAGNDSVSFVFGASYRTVFTDFITVNVDIRDHMFNREFIGDDKLTQNIEFSLGVNYLF